MANSKEAKARIKINKLLEQAGWRFFDNQKGQANISLEPNVKLTQKNIDAFGEDFESIKNGFIDFLLLDEKESSHLNIPTNMAKSTKRQKTILNNKRFPREYAGFTMAEYRELNGFRETIPEYVKDYVSVNQYMR